MSPGNGTAGFPRGSGCSSSGSGSALARTENTCSRPHARADAQRPRGGAFSSPTGIHIPWSGSDVSTGSAEEPVPPEALSRSSSPSSTSPAGCSGMSFSSFRAELGAKLGIFPRADGLFLFAHVPSFANGLPEPWQGECHAPARRKRAKTGLERRHRAAARLRTGDGTLSIEACRAPARRSGIATGPAQPSRMGHGHRPADPRPAFPGGAVAEGQAAGAAQPGDEDPQPVQRLGRRGRAPGPLAAGAAGRGLGQHRPRATSSRRCRAWPARPSTPATSRSLDVSTEIL